MAGDINVILQASVSVFGFDANIDLQLVGGPVSIRLAPEHPVDFPKVWADISNALEEIAGFGLPDLGAWKGLITAPSFIVPSLFLSPSGSNAKGLSVFLNLEFLTPISIGGSIDVGGGVTVSIDPHFEVWALYIGYDAGAGGLTLRAKIKNLTQAGPASPGGSKTQIVSYPFPVPPQDSVGLFKLRYLGIGQRVGPTLSVTSQDPMAAIFDQLESELVGDDPTTILTTLAKNFYQPDRDWFIAADVEMKGFRIRVLFNDPTLYGLEITVAPNSPTPFAGLLFEILYQKLSPNLGVYYGALTLPTLMRRIPLEGFILILPGFSIWVYTNGDFRVNVGWPLGDNSIGISMELLVGHAGFYFAKLRSADNPGAQPSVNYNPILAFGIGVSLAAEKDFNASIFSASLAVNLYATFQGLLAWRDGNEITGPPDHYWFAGTAGISVFIQGTVDFSIIKASVTISFTANAGVAFETGYATLISVSASVSVDIGIKIIFFTIHLSFHTSISTQFTIGSGTPASVNGPLAPGLDIAGGFGTLDEGKLRRQNALETADKMMARLHRGSLRTMVTSAQSPAARLESATRAASISPTPLNVDFVLQPTALYSSSGSSFQLVASLVMDCPGPASPPAASPGQTSFERLIGAMVSWLLNLAQGGTSLSSQFQEVIRLLGQGSQVPLGNWDLFAEQVWKFLQNACTFEIRGIDASTPSAERAAAVMPMLSALAMTYVDINGKTQVVDFHTANPPPSNYAQAVNLYFEDIAWNGNAPPQTTARKLMALGSPDIGASMASFVLVDYFLMQARNAAHALYGAALAYEGKTQEEFLSQVDQAHANGQPESWAMVDLVTQYVDSITGSDELQYLLEHFDYISAAGMGSRFLLGGLQLPVPADVPPVPTRVNMAQVPTAPLYQLTGQQFAAANGANAKATLSLSPTADPPPGWIVFPEASPADNTVASFALPPQLPPAPSPSWKGATSPTEGSDGTVDVELLAPIAPHPLYSAFKSQVGWNCAGAPRTILPLPPDVQTLLADEGALQLQIAPEAPPDSNAQPPSGSPLTPLPATPALLIRLTLSQVPAMALANVASSGSPTSSSPATPGSAVQYLPFVYQLGGADETTRDLIYQALQGDLSQAKVSLLYTVKEGGSPSHGSPAGSATGLRSDLLAPDVLIAKTNLSTLNQIPETSQMLGMLAAALTIEPKNFALVSNAEAFLRLLWEVSVVNAPGFFLYYATAEGDDLPSSLFSSAGTHGGQSAEFDVLVELASSPTTPTAMPAAANATFLNEGGITKTLYGQVFTGEGQPILTYAPTHPAGSVGLSIGWNKVDASPTALVPVEQLYHLMQYRVADEGDYTGSVWSLPIGPTQDNAPSLLRRASSEDLWEYLQSVPIYLFLAGASPGGEVNRYSVIGNQVALQLRILDVYGNPLPDVHTATQLPLYQDPLVGLGEWPGLSISYRVLPATGASATLSISLDFDPDAVVPAADSPGMAIPPRQAWTAALGRYALIVDQLTDPHVSIEVLSSLAGGTAGDSQKNGAVITQLAQTIATNIQNALAGAPSPDVPVVPPAAVTLSIPLPFGPVVAGTENLFSISVSIEISRQESLVYPEVLKNMPSGASVRTEVQPDLSSASSSPSGSGNLTAFAVPFEQAFQNFDGQGGCLKLAQRAGVHSGQNTSEVQSLWAVRFSEKHGISVSLDDSLIFFALRPLSRTPMTHPVGGETYANVDLDVWAYEFLQAFDAFLAPSVAVAIAILDAKENTDFFDKLTDLKNTLADTIPKGVVSLFQEQEGQGNLTAAKERLTQALLTSLSSAFTVTTLIQVPAQVTVAGSTAGVSPNVAPQLFGSIGSPDKNVSPTHSSPQRSAPYSLSNSELDLMAGPSYLTTLLTVAQPEQQAEISLPLSYQVSYLQYDFQPSEEYLGYVPSSWLKFALPDDAPLQMPITQNFERAALPVPLIFQPQPPVLVSQTAQAAALESPSGETPQQEIEEALRWIYSVQMSLALARQDELFFDITYNLSDFQSDHHSLRAQGDSRLPLFEALAEFRKWYAEASPQMGAIAAAAYPARAGAPPTESPMTGQEIVSGFYNYAQSVVTGWQKLFLPTLRSRIQREIILDHFKLMLDSESATTIHLYGLSDDGSCPEYWPTVRTADGQAWIPQPPSPSQTSPGEWFELSHTFGPGAQFGGMTFEFGPLSLLERQSATCASYIRRNAEILPQLTTNPLFIYTTQTSSFANSVIPLIHRTTLPVLQPEATLRQTLSDILAPLAAPSATLKPRLRLSATFAFAVAISTAGEPLRTSTALTLTDNADFEASPDAVVENATRALAAWYGAAPRSTANALLELSATVFGNLSGEELPLLQLDNIPINVAGLDLSWWQSGQRSPKG